MVWKAGVPKWHRQTDTDVLGLGNLAFQDLALTGFQFKLLNISCSPCRSQEEGCGVHGGGSQSPSSPCLSGPQFDRWLWVEINKETNGEEGLSLWGQEGTMKREFASWVWLGKGGVSTYRWGNETQFSKGNGISRLRPPSKSTVSTRTSNTSSHDGEGFLSIDFGWLPRVKLGLHNAGPHKYV